MMEVQSKAIDLLTYTMREASKEKVVPKRYRWSLGNRLIDAALSISSHIDTANSLNLNNPDEASERLLAQRLALASSFQLSSLVFVARNFSGFDESKHVYWTGLIRDEQSLIRGWIDSDRRRLKKGAG